MDEKLLNRGYKKYNPTPFDNKSVVSRFQKRFDDDFGKKYFIDVLKWSQEYVATDKRDKWWKPFVYEYEMQITMGENENPINIAFFSSWTIEEVEEFAESFFERMKPNYYESWDGDRRVRP